MTADTGLGPSRAETHVRELIKKRDGKDGLVMLPASIIDGLLLDIDTWRTAATRRRQRADGINEMAPLPYTEEESQDRKNAVRDIISLLPDDRELGLQILAAARRMVERFKR
jgi:hypothetical protein